MNIIKRRTVSFAVSFLLSFCAAQALPTNAVFYGLESNAPQQSVTMVQDLFFNQLASLNNLTVEDRRDTTYAEAKSADALPQTGIIFFMEMTEESNTWTCVFHGELPETGKKAEYTKKYDSFYKILTDAKSSIQAVVSSLAAPNTGTLEDAPPSASALPSIDIIAGTWTGEEMIDKTVILRSGRGFVIYKNGASMNISVKITGRTILLTQTGKPNASFFPDLPRDVALEGAQRTGPIEWKLELTDQNTLSGIKHTLVPVFDGSNGSVVSAHEGDTGVMWTRQAD